MAAIFDAIRSAMGGASQEPNVPTGYQPSELAAPRSISGLNDVDRFGPSSRCSKPLASYSSVGMKDDDGLWPGESRARPPSPPPARESLLGNHMGSHMGSHRGSHMDSHMGNPMDAPNHMGSHRGSHMDSHMGNPMDAARSSFRSGADDFMARGGAADHLGAPLSSYRSSGIPEDRHSADPFPPRARGPHASFAPGPPDRIPSFRTDVDSSPCAAPKGLTKETLAAHNRLDSFATEVSCDPSSASAARGYSAPPPPPPMPGSSSVANSFMDHDDLFQHRQSSAAYKESNLADGALRLGVTSAPFKAAPVEERPCDKWAQGSVIEVFSASAGRWYAAQVSKVQTQGDGQEVLTVVFYVEGEVKEKSVYRTDSALAPLNSHTFGDLPPGFETRPSQSKPGQLVYLDATTGTKYASLELSWRLHFERLQRQPVGCETVACIPSRGKAAAQPEPIAGVPSPMKALSISELGHLGVAERQCAEQSPAAAGKVALPSFGDSMGSQAAYLGYVGTPGPATGYAPDAHPDAADALAGGYQVVNASAPKRPLKIRDVNPALQTWQDDAFSEWRR